MKSLIAKPIIKNQYWLITNGIEKVGNVTLNNLGYTLTINGNNKFFNNKEELKKQTNIKFQTLTFTKKVNIPFAEYPTSGRVYNSMMDIKKKLHLYTKTRKSKCIYAAGWFVMEFNNVKKIVLCPKYIFIQRYKYSGPFKTKQEAEQKINN